MRYLLIVALFLTAGVARGQAYRLAYESDDMPELTNTARIYAQMRLPDGTYKSLKGGYKISSADAEIAGGNRIRYTEQTLSRTRGALQCTLEIMGRRIPLTLNMPVLHRIHINLYTDSIKPVLNYYVNVEGTYSSGRVLPLDSSQVRITASNGQMAGMEWLIPAQKPIPYDRVHFTAIYKFNTTLHDDAIVYIKKLITD